MIQALHQPLINGQECEGYVVRVARSFKLSEFRRVVAKYVRANHVVTHNHWMQSNVEKNRTV